MCVCVHVCSNTAGKDQPGSSMVAALLLHNETAVSPEETTPFFFFFSNKSAELKKLGSEGETTGERKG